MRNWSVQDVEARFGEFLETCLREGPQLMIRNDADAAVLVPIDDWHRLRRSGRPSLKELLLSEEARVEFPLATRAYRRRPTPRALD